MLFFAGLGDSLVHAFIPGFLFTYQKSYTVIALTIYAFSISILTSCSLDALAKLPKYITRATQGIIILLEYFYGSLVLSKRFVGDETYWSMIAIDFYWCTRDSLKEAGVLVIELLKNISQGVISLFNTNVKISELFSKKHNCSTVKPVKKSNTYLRSSILNMRPLFFLLDAGLHMRPSENTSQPQCKPTA